MFWSCGCCDFDLLRKHYFLFPRLFISLAFCVRLIGLIFKIKLKHLIFVEGQLIVYYALTDKCGNLSFLTMVIVPSNLLAIVSVLRCTQPICIRQTSSASSELNFPLWRRCERHLESVMRARWNLTATELIESRQFE